MIENKQEKNKRLKESMNWKKEEISSNNMNYKKESIIRPKTRLIKLKKVYLIVTYKWALKGQEDKNIIMKLY